MKHNLETKKGFTLLEVIIAIFVITVGIVGVSILISRTISSATFSSQRLTAAYLAQEGIEIVRNIRDTNWLQAYTASSPWDDGLPAGDWEADYTTVTFSNTVNFEDCTSATPGHNCDDYDGDFLRINGGFYNYDSGTETKFKRKVTILPGANTFDVRAEVFWGDKSLIIVQEKLYNWKP